MRQAYAPTINKKAVGAPNAATQKGKGQPKILSAFKDSAK
jgi:hypothetical protein